MGFVGSHHVKLELFDESGTVAGGLEGWGCSALFALRLPSALLA